MSDPVALPDTPLDSPRRRDPAATRRLWADRLDRFRAAEQTVAAFCAAEGVAVPAFYQWKRVLPDVWLARRSASAALAG